MFGGIFGDLFDFDGDGILNDDEAAADFAFFGSLFTDNEEETGDDLFAERDDDDFGCFPGFSDETDGKKDFDCFPGVSDETDGEKDFDQ